MNSDSMVTTTVLFFAFILAPPYVPVTSPTPEHFIFGRSFYILIVLFCFILGGKLVCVVVVHLFDGCVACASKEFLFTFWHLTVGCSVSSKLGLALRRIACNIQVPNLSREVSVCDHSAASITALNTPSGSWCWSAVCICISQRQICL